MSLVRRLLGRSTHPSNDLPRPHRTNLAHRSIRRDYSTVDQLGPMLRLSGSEIESGQYRTRLYRFITNQIPLLNAVVGTWSRLAAAPGRFVLEDDAGSRVATRAEERLQRLADRLAINRGGQPAGLAAFLVDLFRGLFRDGLFGGLVIVHRDGSGVDRFLPVDAQFVRWDDEHGRICYEPDQNTMALDRPDFYYLAFDDGVTAPLGRSILRAVPFVSYIEQQLVDDMRRASHNSGYHRLHVKITPPERMAGESETGYVDRINSYFDSTLGMVRSCEVDENPVTWDNVEINTIGPHSTVAASNRWYLNHRAMVEEICAGTGLAPFLLGYAFGETRTWAAFKFDLVMRQVRSVQAEAARMLKWIGDIELALADLDVRCRFEFDNSFAYQANDVVARQSQQLDAVLKLYQAGLLNEASARLKAADLLK